MTTYTDIAASDAICRPVHRAAVRDLERLPKDVGNQITADLSALRDEPFGKPPRIKRLRGFSFPLYRIRTGDDRSLYRVDEHLVTVLRVIHRGVLDRTLRQFRL